MTKAKSIRLATLGQIRREMARVYGDGRSGVLLSIDAYRLSAVLGGIAKTLVSEDLEARIKHLEDRLP